MSVLRNSATVAALWAGCSLFAQQKAYHVRHFSIGDGLSHRQVNDIVQDDQGFLWIGTEAGLDRYDGYSFKHWDHRYGLSPGPVSMICLDHEGWLWVTHQGSEGTLMGLDLVEVRTGRVSTLAERFNTDLDPKVLMGDLIVDHDGSVIALGRTGDLHRFRNGAVEKSQVQWPEGGAEPQPLLIDITRDGHIWALLGKATIVELTSEGKVLRVRDLRTPNTPRVFRTRPSRAGDSPYFIRSNTHGVGEMWRIDEQEGPVFIGPLHDELFDNYGRCMRLDLPDGTHVEHSLVLDAEGRVLFDIGAVWPHIRYRVLCGAVDRSGKAWIGGDFGLYQMEITTDRFQRWLFDEAIPLGHGKRCRGMTEWNGRLFVNTELEGYFGLSLVDGRVLSHDRPGATGFVLTRDNTAGRWIDGQDALHHLDASGTERVYHCGWETWSVLTDPREGVLLGQRQGIVRLDTVTGICSPYSDGYNTFTELSSAFVMRMEHDVSGNVWLCTDMGLYRLEPGKGVVERFWTGGEGVHHLPDDAVHHIAHDRGGRFWISTGSNGLLHWERNGGVLRRWSREQGMPSNTVHAAYPDRDGHVWMPTESGIARLDSRSGIITSYGTQDGITHHEFNRISHTRLIDGRLCFGGLNGITVFDPLLVNASSVVLDHPLVMTRFEQFDADSGHVVDRSFELERTGRIVVRPGDRALRLDVALLTFDGPGRLRYAWRIEDRQTHWNEQVSPTILPGDLPYGHWKIRVRGCDASGHWSMQELVYDLEVVPPWYQRWWVLAAALLLLAGLLVLLFRLRLRRQLEVLHIRDRIAMDLHDEVGGTLSRLALMADTANAMDPSIRPETRKLLDRISASSSAALEAMNDIVWAVRADDDSGEGLVARMRNTAAQACGSIGATLHFDADPELERTRLSITQRRDLYLLYKEAVNNAIKHAACSVLRVEVALDGRELQLAVVDNGKGFDPEGVHDMERTSGQGLANMRTRAQALGGALQVHSALHTGTRVEFRMHLP